jgi:hypothetical protein
MMANSLGCHMSSNLLVELNKCRVRPGKMIRMILVVFDLDIKPRKLLLALINYIHFLIYLGAYVW